VQQAIDTAQVHERAVVGDVLDHAVDDGAFLQRRETPSRPQNLSEDRK
jgi:hypothetical protein